jgi:hypothetical protein
MALHHTGGGLHQFSNPQLSGGQGVGYGPTVVIPSTGQYFVDCETDSGVVQLLNATTQAVITTGSGLVTLQAGTVVQFRHMSPSGNARGASGRIVAYAGNQGGER